jgi:hypothetical protein
MLAMRVHHHLHHGVPGVVLLLLYIVAVLASIFAVIGLFLWLISRGGNTTRPGWGNSPVFANWLYVAFVAIVAWVLLAIL